MQVTMQFASVGVLEEKRGNIDGSIADQFKTVEIVCKQGVCLKDFLFFLTHPLNVRVVYVHVLACFEMVGFLFVAEQQ